VLLLAQEIEAEKEREREREKEKEKAQKTDESGTNANAGGESAPMATDGSGEKKEQNMLDVTSSTGAPPDGEEDARMEDR
jgi:hypothetical protein